MTVITSYPTKDSVIAYVREMKKKCPGSKILISGYQALQVKSELVDLGDVIVLEQIQEIIDFVDQHSEQPFRTTGVSKFA